MNSTGAQTNGQLRREIGLCGAIFLGLGSIIGTGVFVSIGIATDVAGVWVIVAIILAGILATCNGLSSAQLAAATPVSGGTYEYGYLHLRPSFGFAAGWMFLVAKSASAATAALGFAGYLGRLANFDSKIVEVSIATAAVVVLTVCVLGGIRRSTWLNTIIVSITLLSLAIFVIIATPIAMNRFSTQVSNEFSLDTFSRRTDWTNILQATALMFVAYTGYGRIATLGEEVHDPRRTIPRAVIATLLLSMALYLIVSVAGIGAVGAAVFAQATIDTAAPLEFVASQSSINSAAAMIASGAMIAMLGVLLNLILGLSRVLLAMGRRGDMPRRVANVNERSGAPHVAICIVSTLIVILVIVGDIKLAWSFSALTVLIYYAITNLSALRLAREDRMFRPAVAWLGLLGCLGLTVFIDGKTWIIGGCVMLAGLIWFIVARQLRLTHSA